MLSVVPQVLRTTQFYVDLKFYYLQWDVLCAYIKYTKILEFVTLTLPNQV